jgi:chromosome segregation ATPase
MTAPESLIPGNDVQSLLADRHVLQERLHEINEARERLMEVEAALADAEAALNGFDHEHHHAVANWAAEGAKGARPIHDDKARSKLLARVHAAKHAVESTATAKERLETDASEVRKATAALRPKLRAAAARQIAAHLVEWGEKARAARAEAEARESVINAWRAHFDELGTEHYQNALRAGVQLRNLSYDQARDVSIAALPPAPLNLFATPDKDALASVRAQFDALIGA